MEVISERRCRLVGFAGRRGEGRRRIRAELSVAAQAGNLRLGRQQGCHRADEGRRGAAFRQREDWAEALAKQFEGLSVSLRGVRGSTSSCLVR